MSGREETLLERKGTRQNWNQAPAVPGSVPRLANRDDGMTRRRRSVRIHHQQPLASVGDRIVAAVIDGFFLSVAGTVLFPVAGILLGLGDDDTSIFVVLFAWVVLGWIYEMCFTAISGQTLGKKIVAIKVVGPDGKPPGWTRAIKRTALGIVAAFLPGPAGDVAAPLVQARVLWDKERQGYHDLFAGTHVVREDERPRVRLPRR